MIPVEKLPALNPSYKLVNLISSMTKNGIGTRVADDHKGK